MKYEDGTEKKESKNEDSKRMEERRRRTRGGKGNDGKTTQRERIKKDRHSGQLNLQHPER